MGNLVGNIEKDGEIKDQYGWKKGEVDSDGEAKDANGNVVGTIGRDGEVRDCNGNRIGDANGMSNEQAAYLFFLDN